MAKTKQSLRKQIEVQFENARVLKRREAPLGCGWLCVDTKCTHDHHLITTHHQYSTVQHSKVQCSAVQDSDTAQDSILHWRPRSWCLYCYNNAPHPSRHQFRGIPDLISISCIRLVISTPGSGEMMVQNISLSTHSLPNSINSSIFNALIVPRQHLYCIFEGVMPLMAQLTGVVVEAPVVDDAGEAGAGPGGGLVHALPQRLQPATMWG